VTATETGRHAGNALLGRLIDHAPLFPPASLPVDQALAADRAARADAHAWMLARLVWPASRLAELDAAGRSLSVVLDVPVDDFVAQSHKLRALEAVELRRRDEPAELAGLAPEVYVELPLDGDLPGRLDELAALGLRAKVRCGSDAVPAGGALAEFIRLCRERGVAFKATAGLHHAVRTAGAHGVLNVLAAAVFDDEEAALAEERADSFSLDAEAFRWRDREARPDELERVRRSVFASIGSCSFKEPVDELRALGLL
jgi:hypothetical protein